MRISQPSADRQRRSTRAHREWTPLTFSPGWVPLPGNARGVSRIAELPPNAAAAFEVWSPVVVVIPSFKRNVSRKSMA